MDNIVPYQEIKLENQSVDEIVEDIGILKKIEEASKFEIGRRLVYLKETCKHGEYLPKLEEVGIRQQDASKYINFYTRFGKYYNCSTLRDGKIRELLRIPKGKEEEYLDNLPDPNEVTAKQLREEIDKLKKENDRLNKEQISEQRAKEALIKSNEQLQQQLENEKRKAPKVNTVYQDREVKPADYDFIKSRLEKLEGENKVLSFTKETLSQELDRIRNDIDEKDEQLRQYEELNRKLNELGIGMDIREQYLEDTTELAQLVGSMEYFFDEKLAPTKYKRCLKYYKSENSVVKSLRDIIEKMEDWLIEIKSYLPESNVIIDNTDIIDVNHTEVE